MNAELWNEFVATNGPRSGAFLQSWEWGEFQRALGRQVIRVSDNAGVAQLLEYPIRAGFYGFDIPRGPIGPQLGKSIPSLIGNALKEAKKVNTIFLHVEPLGPIGPQLGKSVPSNCRQPQQTLVLDLEKSEDKLLAAMHEKTRYNIRLAERKGVVVDVTNDANVFVRLLRQTTARDRFSSHPREYYSTMLRMLSSGGCEVRLFVARYQGQPLAAALIVTFGKTATYLHGASADEHREVKATQLLQWHAIRFAKQHGCRWYDFWGVDEQRWPGVTRFKLGFGGIRESYPDAFDLPLRPFWYKVYRLGRLILKP